MNYCVLDGFFEDSGDDNSLLEFDVLGGGVWEWDRTVNPENENELECPYRSEYWLYEDDGKNGRFQTSTFNGKEGIWYTMHSQEDACNANPEDEWACNPEKMMYNQEVFFPGDQFTPGETWN